MKHDSWESTERSLELLRAMVDYVQTEYKKNKDVDEWEPYLKEVRIFAAEVRERRYNLCNKNRIKG